MPSPCSIGSISYSFRNLLGCGLTVLEKVDLPERGQERAILYAHFVRYVRVEIGFSSLIHPLELATRHASTPQAIWAALATQ